MRKTALRRRTPLSPVSLKRARQTKRTAWNSTIPAKSAKRKREDRERTEILRELKAKHPMCQRCGVRPSAEGHEPLTRARGGSALDRSNIVMLCNFPAGGCHRWIHDHIAEATEEGWLISRYA